MNMMNLLLPQIAQKYSHRRTGSVVRGLKLKQIHIRRTIRSPARPELLLDLLLDLIQDVKRYIFFYIHMGSYGYTSDYHIL